MNRNVTARNLLRAAKELLAARKIVVTKIKDIPDLQEKVDKRKVTYRGLGAGKLSDDFEKLAGEGGVKIKVDGKEYYMTDSDFKSLGGIKKMRFRAPSRSGSTHTVAKEIMAAGKGPLEYPADWDARSKWLKEAKRVAPKKITPARAKQLTRDHSSPMKPGYEFGMTQAEHSYVLEVWQTLPGTSSFDSTMYYISKGKAASTRTASADPKEVLKKLVSIKITMAEAQIGNALDGKTFKSVKDIERALSKFPVPDAGHDKVFTHLQFEDGELNGFRYYHGKTDPSFSKQLDYYIKQSVTVTIED